MGILAALAWQSYRKPTDKLNSTAENAEIIG
jgi:hypothetical protein